MVPDKFNMVDMGGIDLIMAQGEEVPGLYSKLVESIAQCRYQCLYNWYFDGIVIPPTYVVLEVNENDEVEINEGVTVTDEDVIRIYSIETGATIIPLLADHNGSYNAPFGVDGFNPVTVEVPNPPLQEKTASINGLVQPDSGYYGLSSVNVQVSGSGIEGTIGMFTGEGSITIISGINGTLNFLILALNGEASTKNLNLSATKNGNPITVETIEYHQYTGQTPNTRNYRIGIFSLDIAYNDVVVVSCDQAGYAQLMAALTTFDISSVDLAMTSNDARITGSSVSGDFVFYGYINANSNIGIGNLIPYTDGETIDTGPVPSNYGAGYIFWLS